jgi:RNA polymerase sigma-70 factor (sigma-E family)
VGEAADFQDYVLARRRSLLRTAWLLTGDWHAAEDLVQIALMRCYPRWSHVEPGSADAYVRRAMINVFTSSWRRLWRGEVSTAELPDSAAPDVYAGIDQRRTVLMALAALPARQRATVVLRFFDDASEADTAVALGCSVGTVKSQTSKALAQLRSSGLLLDLHDRPEVRHE